MIPIQEKGEEDLLYTWVIESFVVCSLPPQALIGWLGVDDLDRIVMNQNFDP
jgi:hypothetical protein